ncbi:hypothetical protein BT93_H0337 [Corymbia citriodora subsp. variegata]|nr:hypothetical protein BT93_H0337 [Corymbia citriodora subsp. variegata]
MFAKDRRLARPPAPPVFKPRRVNKCPVYILATVVVLGAVALVFSLIVLRPSDPEFELSDVSVKLLNYTRDDTAAWLDATLDARAAVKNTNFGRFEFGSCNLTVSYNGTLVGEKELGGGTVWSRETKYVDVTVRVGSSSISDLKNFSSDMSDNVLELTSYAELRGWVHLIKIVKRRLKSEMNCTISLDLSNRRVQDLICR